MVMIQEVTSTVLARQTSRQHWLPCGQPAGGAEAFDERDLPVSFERGQSPHGSRILQGNTHGHESISQDITTGIKSIVEAGRIGPGDLVGREI